MYFYDRNFKMDIVMKCLHHINSGTANLQAELDDDILSQYLVMNFHCQSTYRQRDG